jgi:hypothetical protein
VATLVLVITTSALMKFWSPFVAVFHKASTRKAKFVFMVDSPTALE